MVLIIRFARNDSWCYPKNMKNLTLIMLISSSIAFSPVQARDDSAWGVVKSTSAILVGTPVSFFTGAARGATNKAADYSDTLAGKMGGGTFASVVGYPVGFVGGALIGAAGGAVKGVYNGIYYGVEEPYSKQNFTVEGDFADFEPFDYDEYSAGYSSI